MSYKNYNAKVDANQPEIVKALRRFGAVVKPVHRLKDFFDILVAYNGKLYAMEIKNPEKLPKEYDAERLEKELTEGECKCMNEFKKVGVPYYIVTSIDDAISVLKGK